MSQAVSRRGKLNSHRAGSLQFLGGTMDCTSALCMVAATLQKQLDPCLLTMLLLPRQKHPPDPILAKFVQQAQRTCYLQKV